MAETSKRYLTSQVLEDLNKKMVFLAGPRQVGKTTLSKGLYSKFEYLNWDIDSDRSKILRQEFQNENLIIFDEIHKYKTWRNYLKGIYDQTQGKKKILVTGSAKLDLFRRGGDSLQGRYHFLRLHPLSLAELGNQSQSDLQTLFNLSGFPEPFFSGSKKETNRWSQGYGSLLVNYEIADLEQFADLGNLELLFYRLPALVGSPLSINALREDLRLAHKTVDKWIQALERIYGLFRVAPFGHPKIKAVKKEQKHYHFDWNLIHADGPRFENLVACGLLKWVHWKIDTEGEDFELRYFRDSEGREVDFVVTYRMNPFWAVEVKLGDDTISPHLKYFKNKFPSVKCFQISLKGKKDYETPEGIRVMPAYLFLKGLI